MKKFVKHVSLFVSCLVAAIIVLIAATINSVLAFTAVMDYLSLNSFVSGFVCALLASVGFYILALGICKFLK